MLAAHRATHLLAAGIQFVSRVKALIAPCKATVLGAAASDGIACEVHKDSSRKSADLPIRSDWVSQRRILGHVTT
jgi:hypothetical protein